MDWRVVEHTEVELLTEVAGFEAAFPTFYRDSSNTRTATAEDMLRFYGSCHWLFGLFEGDAVVGLAYFQKILSDVDEVHLDLKRGTDTTDCVKCFAGIRDHRYQNGMRRCMSWTFRRNKVVRQMLEAIGFELSGLTMKLGSSHGRVLEWRQMLLDRG